MSVVVAANGSGPDQHCGRARCSALLLALCSACSGPDAPEASTFGSALIGGSLDGDDVGVVALLGPSGFYCTGTLIDPHVVVTAAHCVTDDAPSAVFFGMATHEIGQTVAVSQARQHPEYVPSSGSKESKRDLAALLLSSPAPAEARPWPLLTAAHAAQLHEGTEVRLVGYGGESEGGEAVAARQEGRTVVDHVDEGAFYHHASPARTCFGDSGGPAFVTIDSVEYLAGVASGGDAECETIGKHARVEAAYEDFFRHFPNPTAQFAERCFRDDNCVTGACVQPLDGDGFPYCSRACSNHADCGGRTTCVMDKSGDRYCRHANPPPGALGAACSAPSDCALEECEVPADASDAVCTIRCFPENAVACPIGLECRAGLQALSFCFPQRRDPVGPPAAPDDAISRDLAAGSDTGSGCAVRGYADQDSSSQALCVLLGVCSIAIRRRRPSSPSSSPRSMTSRFAS